MVAADDAAIAPDLDNGSEVDLPSVFEVGEVYDVHALHKGAEEGAIDCLA